MNRRQRNSGNRSKLPACRRTCCGGPRPLHTTTPSTLSAARADQYAFADLIARKGADVVQPDNRRAGGVTEWMEIAALADAAGLELASRGGGATNLNMLLAMPNAIYMESSGARKMVNNEVAAPEAPGMSSEVSEAEIRRYKAG
jgi:L-alanine-DL-glutamate epimerase-like enolase superfamily enzyme